MVIEYRIDTCSLGTVVVATTSGAICCLEFLDEATQAPFLLRRRFPKATLIEESNDLQSVALRQLDNPDDSAMDIPLNLIGTPYQVTVWNALRSIPIGATASYREVADKIGHPRAWRAVGNAIATNPVAIIIPCHRVLPSSGALGNYRWGAWRKSALLHREKYR
jgi:AraC family transcriptional regulator of adaptative response/methylated-DNA-[protein]-cysteine methyltransferase